MFQTKTPARAFLFGILVTMILIVSAALGLIIGSFLNVLVLRHGEKTLGGRSACPACGHPIRWYDLIPVLSWFFLKGSCRDCGHPISPQYPLVEAGTAAVFVVIALAPIALPFKIFALPIAALFIAIAVHDLRTTIIPDAWAVLTGILCAGSAIAGALMTDASLVLALIAGPVVAFPLFALWLVSRGMWMGLGDAKLTLSTGWLLGIEGGLASVFLAFILGALLFTPFLLISSGPFIRFKRFLAGSPHEFEMSVEGGQAGLTMKSEIPFGPFLIASCFLVWFSQMYGLDVGILSIFYGI